MTRSENGNDEDTLTPTGARRSTGSDPDFVDRQMQRIEDGLNRVLFGDYSGDIMVEGGDPRWENLAMRINIAINTLRRAIEAAEESEQQASAARDKAVAAARAEAQFLTNVTHELNTPLAAIRASAEILNDFPDEAKDTRDEFTQIILTEAERLAHLIQNVLDLGRLQGHKLQWEFQELQIGEQLSEVVRAFNLAHGKHGVRVELSIGNELPATIGDRARLMQLWTNLIDNAIKFSKTEVTDKRILVRASAIDDEDIVVEVEDEGIGIHAEDRQRIFDRFCQGRTPQLTDKPQGAGLGLSIAKEIAIHHGGDIDVESEVGVGSTFRVRLPVPQLGQLEALNQRLKDRWA